MYIQHWLNGAAANTSHHTHSQPSYRGGTRWEILGNEIQASLFLFLSLDPVSTLAATIAPISTRFGARLAARQQAASERRLCYEKNSIGISC